MSIFSKFRYILVAVVALVGGRAVAQTTEAPDAHRNLAIYQIMVASFQHSPDGAVGYTALWGPDGHTKNGNIKGITAALDYIKSLGVNAIWLTPVFDSSKAFGGEKLQATGYFTNNYFSIDPHFGTDADFRELIDEAHKRGLYVILDGVFGHHGGVEAPSPKGHSLDSTPVYSVRGLEGGQGNVKYPGSLDYIKDVATYWIEEYGIDGWRLDQAYQACQDRHNYWLEIRRAVEDAAAARASRGEQWGTLAYMVGEDWGHADVINKGVYKDGGLLSAFDFDGKELISGPMQSADSAGLENGWADVITVLSEPVVRGYLNNKVIPNLFLTNHDGYRLADHFDPSDPYYYEKQMARIGILAAYSGPITLYYGDEYADRTLETTGGQKDNVARTSGHLKPRNDGEQRLRDFTAAAMRFRADNPAMWRGTAAFKHLADGGLDVLVVEKYDAASDNLVAVVFSATDADVPVAGLEKPLNVKAWQPAFVKIK